MRLYIPALDIQKLNPSLIEKYYLKQTEASLIFSTEGIFQLSADKITRITITDGLIENHEIELIDSHDKLHKIELVADNSEWNIGTEPYWQVPAGHENIVLVKHFYRLRAGAGLDLVIEECDKTITDFYFVINVPKTKLNKNDGNSKNGSSKDININININKKRTEERISINNGAADDIFSFITELKYIDVL